VQEWIIQLRIAGNAFSKDGEAAKQFPRQLAELRDSLMAGWPGDQRRQRQVPHGGIKIGELARAMGGIKTVQISREEWNRRYGDQQHTSD
jgi:hypothetical protein